MGWNLKLSLVIALAWAITLFLPQLHPRPILDKVTNVPALAQASDTEVSISSIHVPILMYHHVGALINNDALTLDLTVSPEDFEAQVVYFKNLGYETVSLQALYDALANGQKLPSQPIVFTFDDGYQDVFTQAIPILKKYGYSGSFAIATELLGRPGYASWDEVISAQKSGMEIVSHTENHLDLTSKIYSEADLHREIFGSKEILEQKLKSQVNIFIYPYGKYDERDIGLLKDAGYKMALTTEYGQDVSGQSLFTTPRVRVHGGSTGLDKLKTIFGQGRHTAFGRTSL